MLEKLTEQPLHTLLLVLADDEFIYGYRNSEWTGIAPLLEEDVAFSSMAQDEIGHARLLYEMLAEETGVGADHIAYGRQPEEYLSCRLMDTRKVDWAHAIARQFLYDTADHVRLDALSRGSYAPLANAAGKILREEKYHLMHADMWLNRLATMSDDTRQRLVHALVEVWPGALGVFEELPGEESLVNEGVLPEPMTTQQARWLEEIAPILQGMDLPFPARLEAETGIWLPTIEPEYGGRRGKHSDDFRLLWGEMTEVYRIAPEAVW